MATTENIRDIFSILHDGTISCCTGDKNLLTLTVDCQYLAERIDKSFENFYVDLIQIQDLYFETWPNPFDLPMLTLTDINEIFKADLEILSADIKEKLVLVTCNQHDKAFDYSGGNLFISCNAIKIYDQSKRELSIDEFGTICKSYWDEFSRKSNHQ